MKEVIYRNRTSRRHQRRVVSVNEYNQEKDVKTHVQKSFLYHVTPVEGHDFGENAPEIFINKAIDTGRKLEEFTFRVRGSFVTNSDQKLMRVEFVHKLRITMAWTDQQFSPKKSVTLT